MVMTNIERELLLMVAGFVDGFCKVAQINHSTENIEEITRMAKNLEELERLINVVEKEYDRQS